MATRRAIHLHLKIKKRNNEKNANKNIEATGNRLCRFSARAGCPLRLIYPVILELMKKKKRNIVKIQLKSIVRIIFIAIAGAIISQAVGLNIWPYILILYDRTVDKKPDPSISLVVWEKVNNSQFLNYIDRCDEFQQFLINTKLAYKLPWNIYFAQTVEETGQRPSCAVSALFRNYIHGRNEVFYLCPSVASSVDIDNCPDCKKFIISIGNSGKRKADYIRARIRLNKNWAVQSVVGNIAEQRDDHTFVIYRDNIIEKDVLNTVVFIRNATGNKIDPAEFIEKLWVTYGWRGIEMELDQNNISLLYALSIENCKVNCKSNSIDNFDITEWDGFGNIK